MGLGWYLYFQLVECVVDCVFCLFLVELIGIDVWMIFIGKCYVYIEFMMLKFIGVIVFDNCFVVVDIQVEVSVYLSGLRGIICYWQEIGL